jgi:ribosomal protein S18 acetylase RimI-like enzyme
MTVGLQIRLRLFFRIQNLLTPNIGCHTLKDRFLRLEAHKSQINMPFQISPVEEGDCLDWASVHYLSFSSSPSGLYIREPCQETYEKKARDFKNVLKSPSERVFKAVDVKLNKMVGIAHWTIHDKERTDDEIDAEFGLPEPIPEEILEFRKAYTEATWKTRRGLMGCKPYVYLGMLMVIPEYQRLGLGTMLMQWGVDQADR